MSVSKVKYRPQGEILCRFGLSTADVQIIMGPLGSGKTKAVVFKIMKLISEQTPDANGIRKSRIAVIRNTYPDLQTTTIREFKECVSPAVGVMKNGHPPMFHFNFELPDGTVVEATCDFLALDRLEDVRKLRGTQYTFGWLNEIKELPKPVLDMLLGRIDRYPQPGFSKWVGIIADTNAWDEDHWLETLEEEKIQGGLEGYEFFMQPGAVKKVDPDFPGSSKSMNGTYWAVNPIAENLVVLRPAYYQRQIAAKKDDWIKVNLANEKGLSLDGKAVHPDYQESTHRASKPLKALLNVPIFVGMDYGLTPAASFWQRTPMGVWHALEEIVFEDGDAVKLADAIKITIGEMKAGLGLNPANNESLRFIFRGDPAGDERAAGDSSQTVFKILRLNGIPALAASTNDPSMRRAALDRPLTRMVNGQPGLLVSPKCKYLRKGLAGGFQYKRIQVKGDERFQNKPDKNFFSHIVEAAEYALMDAGEHSVSDATGIGVIKMPSHPVTARYAPQAPRNGPGWDVFNI